MTESRAMKTIPFRHFRLLLWIPVVQQWDLWWLIASIQKVLHHHLWEANASVWGTWNRDFFFFAILKWFNFQKKLHKRSHFYFYFFSLDTDETNQSQPGPAKNTQSNHNQLVSKVYSDYQAVPSLVENDNLMRTDAEKKSFLNDFTQKSRNNRVRRGMMAGPIATTTQVTLLTSFPKPSNSLFCSLCSDIFLSLTFLRVHTKEDWVIKLRFPSCSSEKMTQAASPWRGCPWLA